MKVATILGIPNLHLEEDNDYHMCLAHLLAKTKYRDFFRAKARRGDMVIMDNGVVETGLPMEWSLLKELSIDVESTHLVLPDRLYNSKATLKAGEAAIKDGIGTSCEEPPDLIAVPQGRDFNEWEACLNEMLDWPVATIGISKFIGSFMSSRIRALEVVPQLIESDKTIHVLGCISITNEATALEARFPGRIMGIDSGIATICTQVGMRLSALNKRLDIPLDFFTKDLDMELLEENVNYWRFLCGKSIQGKEVST